MSSKTKMPEEVTEELLTHLSNNMTQSDLIELATLMGDHQTKMVRKKLKAHIPEKEEIFNSQSLKQYFQQKIELTPTLNITLRTIPSWANDEAIRYASKQTDESEPMDVYKRIHTRRRLSYALVKVNEKVLSNEIIDGSYVDLIIDGVDVKELLKEAANQVYSCLEVFDDIMVQRIILWFLNWEDLINETTSGITIDTVKN